MLWIPAPSPPWLIQKHRPPPSPRRRLEKMDALVVRRLGDPTLAPGGEASPFAPVTGDHPAPALASPTSVRVRVAATSLNFATYLQVQGKYQERPALPFVPGSDYAGFVDAVGPAVRRFRPGDRVCGLAAVGSFADLIVADEKQLWVLFFASRCLVWWSPFGRLAYSKWLSLWKSPFLG